MGQSTAVFPPTLRALPLGVDPSRTQASLPGTQPPDLAAAYDRLGSLLSDARLAGLVSWDHLEDRERNLMGLSSHNTPQGYLRTVCSPEGYRRDLWADQPMRPEVWVEKKAMQDVVGQVCSRLRVDFFACKGYVSQSEQYRAGQHRESGEVARKRWVVRRDMERAVHFHCDSLIRT